MAEKVSWQKLKSGSAPKKALLEVPLGKLKKNLGERKTGEFVILVSTGSYAPIHRGHVKIFDIAKNYIEKKDGCEVIGAFLSPSGDHYVGNKVGEGFLPAVHRIKMCQLATAESTYLEVTDWECNHDGWGSPTKLIAHITKFIEDSIPGISIRPIYVCGADHAIKYTHYLTKKLPKEEITILRRGYDSELKEVMKKNTDVTKAHLFHVPDEEIEGISSTDLRNFKIKGDDEGCLKITFPAVLEYWKTITEKTQ